MATTTITATDVPAGGYNLTDSADFETLVTGAGNGVEFTFDLRDVIVLKNDTGGAAAFTIKVPTPTKYSDVGSTIPDETVSVADGKTYLYPMLSIFKYPSTRTVIIECDVAGKVLVARPAIE